MKRRSDALLKPPHLPGRLEQDRRNTCGALEYAKPKLHDSQSQQPIDGCSETLQLDGVSPTEVWSHGTAVGAVAARLNVATPPKEEQRTNDCQRLRIEKASWNGSGSAESSCVSLHTLRTCRSGITAIAWLVSQHQSTTEEEEARLGRKARLFVGRALSPLL